jgi:methylthioribose-1-phosphate isomerase
LQWEGTTDGCLLLLDQRRLPVEVVFERCVNLEQVWHAIKTLCVRGAPAIGVAAAYGVVLGIRAYAQPRWEDLQKVTDHLRTSRPTAVNLFWALERMERAAQRYFESQIPRTSLTEHLLCEAQQIEAEDVDACRLLGDVGERVIADRFGVLTHCNAGALVAAGCGTALAPMFTAWQRGKRFHVYADETRPLLQGARLTAWELQQHGIPVTLICDNMAAQVMREGKIQLVIVGADRIAANGDTANKIGTYGVAVLARFHSIPFYVVAPKNTFDLNLQNGQTIPIEQRSPGEVTAFQGVQVAPSGIDVYNPAFDVTPADYITGIITEAGMISPVRTDVIQSILNSDRL